MLTVRGRIETVFFAGPRFSAGRLRTAAGDRLAFAGKLYAREDDQVVLKGEMVEHPRYGPQLQVETLEYDMDLDVEGLASYLAGNPRLKGIGPAKARIVAERFGADLDRALLESPDAIARAARLSLEAVEALRDEWLRTRAMNEVLSWLSAFGLTHHQVTTLVDRFGAGTRAILEEDPYLLIGEIRGFGFKRVDRIARKMGASKEHPSRIRAGVLYCVDEAIDRGDCWVEYEDLVDRANRLLVMDVLDSRERIEQTLDAAIDAGDLTCSSLAGRFLVARSWLRDMEHELALVFEGGAHDGPAPCAESDRIRLAEPALNACQREAVVRALRHRVTLISGGAGSGKTFTVAAIARQLEARGLQVELAAPTGKAAKRLEQVVGRPASTIHRLLRFDGTDWRHGPDDPLPADVVLVDELSMVCVPLAWRLFRALDLGRTSVVLVGDHNQLPPVGPGNVLRDLIRSRAIPTTILDQVVRQAGVLKENSIAVLRGEVRKTSDRRPDGRRAWYLVDQFTEAMDARRFMVELFETVLADRLGFDLVRDVQVLTPTHKGPLGTRDLNAELQRVVQRKAHGVLVEPTPAGRRPRFLPGDKVIQTRNNYRLGVMNGAMGVVLEAGKGGALWIDFDGCPVEIESGSGDHGDLELGYAVSIHKCVTGETLVPTACGLLPIRELAQGVSPSASADMDVGVASGSGVERTASVYSGGEQAVLRLETRAGYEIGASHRHPLLVATESGMTWKRAPDIAPGDVLVLRVSVP